MADSQIQLEMEKSTQHHGFAQVIETQGIFPHGGAVESGSYL